MAPKLWWWDPGWIGNDSENCQETCANLEEWFPRLPTWYHHTGPWWCWWQATYSHWWQQIHCFHYYYSSPTGNGLQPTGVSRPHSKVKPQDPQMTGCLKILLSSRKICWLDKNMMSLWTSGVQVVSSLTCCKRNHYSWAKIVCHFFCQSSHWNKYTPFRCLHQFSIIMGTPPDCWGYMFWIFLYTFSYQIRNQYSPFWFLIIEFLAIMNLILLHV